MGTGWGENHSNHGALWKVGSGFRLWSHVRNVSQAGQGQRTGRALKTSFLFIDLALAALLSLQAPSICTEPNTVNCPLVSYAISISSPASPGLTHYVNTSVNVK